MVSHRDNLDRRRALSVAHVIAARRGNLLAALVPTAYASEQKVGRDFRLVITSRDEIKKGLND